MLGKYRAVGGAALLAAAMLACAVIGWSAPPPALGAKAAGPRQALPVGPNQTYAVPYFAWNGRSRTAVVVLPRDYVPGAAAEALPCVVEARGRNFSAASHARCWEDLPSTRGFIVICADSSGRRDPANSWGVAGQIDDLADLPAVVEASIPWVKIDRQRLYVVGPSMGGTEALTAIALHPDVFAAGISVDGVADLAARYREYGLVDRLDDRRLMRAEIGGTPRQVPFKYAVRSPSHYAGTLALCGVPLTIWWSADDKLVIHQATTQTGKLYERIRTLSPDSPVTQRIGTGSHSTMLLADPAAAVDYLCPAGIWRTRPQGPPGKWVFKESRPLTHVWGYTVTAPRGLTRFYRLSVNMNRLMVDAPARLSISVPYAGAGPASVVINGASTTVTPVDGAISLIVPSGRSTVVVDP
jgi:pimeloyl-ACP methyl ester carboxylesterase